MVAEDSPSQELVKEFVVAGHGNLPKVKELLTQNPQLLNMAYQWNENDHETAIMGAAQVGSVAVVEFLLARGAPLDICTAAMLGRKKDVEDFLVRDPAAIRSKGAHGIPLLTHAGYSGNVELVKMLVQSGATDGMTSALHSAVRGSHKELVIWMLENGQPDLKWKDFFGKTALAYALGRHDEAIIAVLKSHGAVE